MVIVRLFEYVPRYPLPNHDWQYHKCTKEESPYNTN